MPMKRGDKSELQLANQVCQIPKQNIKGPQIQARGCESRLVPAVAVVVTLAVLASLPPTLPVAAAGTVWLKPVAMSYCRLHSVVLYVCWVRSLWLLNFREQNWHSKDMIPVLLLLSLTC